MSAVATFVAAACSTRMKSLWAAPAVVGIALCIPSISSAQDAQPDTLGEVVVQAYRFLDRDTSGATNLPLPIEGVPQAITLINSDFLKAADLKTMGEIAQYSPGAFYSGNKGNFGTDMKLRGFPASFAIDGLAIGNLNYEPDNAIVERLEIVKGPASVVYGAASPGGLVNLVLKGASPDAPSYLYALGGSWERWRLEGQLAGSLNDAGSLRAIGVVAHQEADSFIDFEDSKRTTVFGGLEADLAEGVTAYAKASYENYQRTGFDNPFLTFSDGRLAPVGRSYNIANKDWTSSTNSKRANAGVKWDVSSAWLVELQTNYQNASTHGPKAYGFGLRPNGDFSITFQNWLDFTLEDTSVGASSVYKFDDLGLEGSFVAASAIYQKAEQSRLQSRPSLPGNPAGLVNISASTDAISDLLGTATYPGPILFDGQVLEYVTLSAQGVFKIAEPVSLLVGLSNSSPKIKARVNDLPFEDFTPDDQMSYRAALTVEPISGLNLYASYSESFQPNLRLDINDDVLPPIEGTQYEVGAKYMSPDRRILLTAAVFDLSQTNQVVFDSIGADGVDRYRTLGEVKHKGFELEAVGRITDRWQIQAGFTKLDPTVEEDVNPAIVGKKRTFLPESTASLYTSYDFTSGPFISGGVRYVDDLRTSYDDTTRRLPSYTLVDSSVGYSFDKWQLQLNVKNMFDEFYVVNTWGTLFYGNVVGEPRSFTLSARMDF